MSPRLPVVTTRYCATLARVDDRASVAPGYDEKAPRDVRWLYGHVIRTQKCDRRDGEYVKILDMAPAEHPESTPKNSAERMTDLISLGVLAEAIPRDLIEDVLTETSRREQRSRLLPAHVVVRFCLAMCLFYDEDYEEVMRQLVGSLKEMDS